MPRYILTKRDFFDGKRLHKRIDQNGQVIVHEWPEGAAIPSTAKLIETDADEPKAKAPVKEASTLSEMSKGKTQTLTEALKKA